MRTSSSSLWHDLDRNGGLGSRPGIRVLGSSRPTLGLWSFVALAAVAGLLAFFAVEPWRVLPTVPASPERSVPSARAVPPPAEPTRPSEPAIAVHAVLEPASPLAPSASSTVAPSPGVRAMAATNAAASVFASAAVVAHETDSPTPITASSPITGIVDAPTIAPDRTETGAVVAKPTSPPPSARSVASDRPATTRTRRVGRAAIREPETTGSTAARRRSGAVRAPSRPAPEPAAPFSLPGALRPGGS